MKKIIAGLTLAVVLVAAPALSAQEVVEEIVAVVNDDVITLSEFRAQFEMAQSALRAQVPEAQQAQAEEGLRKEFLNSLITQILLLQKAKELGLNVQEQLKAAVERIKQDNNITSDADLRRALEQQGVSYEAWLRQYEENILRDAVVYTEVRRSIALGDSEVVQYYKKNPDEFTVPTEYKLNAIYLAGEGRTAEAAESQKAAVDAKLRSGAAFADAATELSDPPMKEAKGELGTFKAGELEPALESAVDKLKAGETSGWINSKNGWYLLQLVEKKDSRLKSFEESRSEVEQKLFAQKSSVKEAAYLKDLREKSYVKILNDPFAPGK
ncbi:MAG: peptidyl-prolyl cis-trans isomerase [Acidobacteriota bacterium]